MLKKTILLAGLLVAAGCGAPEGGEMTLGNSTSELGGRASHCVARLSAAKVGEPITNVEPAQLECFRTFADAISHVSKGAVQLPADATPEKFTDAHADEVGATGMYVIGVEYQHSNFGGSTLTYTHDLNCSMGYYFSASSLPGGWNDVISSARAYSGCINAYHYEHSDYWGAVLNCFVECSGMGAMNDKTSSIQWWP